MEQGILVWGGGPWQCAGVNCSASEGACVTDVHGGAEEEDLFGADISEFFVRWLGIGQHGAYALEGDIVGADDDIGWR